MGHLRYGIRRGLIHLARLRYSAATSARIQLLPQRRHNFDVRVAGVIWLDLNSRY